MILREVAKLIMYLLYLTGLPVFDICVPLLCSGLTEKIDILNYRVARVYNVKRLNDFA